MDRPASASRFWTGGWCASPRSPGRSSMSEQGAPKPAKQDKAAKKGGGDAAAKGDGGKKAAAPEGGKKEKGGGKKDAGPKAGKEARDPNYVPRFKKRYF